MHVKVVVDKDHFVDCYGELRDDSNFEVVCEDEEDDGVWCDGNPDNDDFTFSSWREVVNTLQNEFGSRIDQIEAV